MRRHSIRKHLLGSRTDALIDTGNLASALPRPGVQASSAASNQGQVSGLGSVLRARRPAKGSGAPSLHLALAPFLALAALLVFASSASAAASHPFLETFGSAAQPSFGEPAGMAVDQSTGDLLVIDKFESA